MITENFTFKNSAGQDLAARIYSKEKTPGRGIIFSHGLFSSKDGYKITRLAESLVDGGYRLMTFDFTFSGESPGNISDISVLQEVEDLKAAVREFKSRGVEDIHLMGSSMGAVVSIIAAAEGAGSFKSLVLIAAPVDLLGIIPGMDTEKVRAMDRNGETLVSGISLKNSFFMELDNIDMIGCVKQISCPVLLFHGRMDEVVDFSNFEKIRDNLAVRYESEIVEDGDHHLTRDQDISLMERRLRQWLADHDV